MGKSSESGGLEGIGDESISLESLGMVLSTSREVFRSICGRLSLLLSLPPPSRAVFLSDPLRDRILLFAAIAGFCRMLTLVIEGLALEFSGRHVSSASDGALLLLAVPVLFKSEEDRRKANRERKLPDIVLL